MCKTSHLPSIQLDNISTRVHSNYIYTTKQMQKLALRKGDYSLFFSHFAAVRSPCKTGGRTISSSLSSCPTEKAPFLFIVLQIYLQPFGVFQERLAACSCPFRMLRAATGPSPQLSQVSLCLACTVVSMGQSKVCSDCSVPWQMKTLVLHSNLQAMKKSKISFSWQTLLVKHS